MFETLSQLCKSVSAFLLVAIQTFLAALGIYVDVGGVHGLRTDFAYDFAFGTEKVAQTDFLGYDDTMTMYLAKNEREGCQIVLRNRYVGTKTVRLQVGAFQSEDGTVLAHEVFEVRYIRGGSSKVEWENYPDALVPYTGGEISLVKQVNQPFFIEVRSTPQTPAGTYTAKVEMVYVQKNKEDTVMFETTVSAVVWDFELPDEPACETSMGIFGESFYKLNGIVDVSTGHQNSQTNVEAANALYKQYYDFLLEHKVSAYSLPYDILSEEADAYMSDERVKTFIIPYGGKSDEEIQAYYAKVCSNEVWKKKAYFYPIDEPATSEAYAEYMNITERLNRLCPGYNMATPFNTNQVEIDGETRTSVALQQGKSNILCPISNLYDTTGFSESIAASGSRSWWYVCCQPTGDYCNLFMTNEGLRHRILFWQQKANNIQGLLYWDTVYWDKCGDPWYNAQTWDAKSYGDGSLMYPGRMIGIDSPIASLRLKGVANGIEDFEYFTMAEELLGRAYVDSVIKKVTTSLTKYTTNDAKFDKIRLGLGTAIENALN